MDRLAEQVVAWHNKHLLAKRISIYDVHTIGVVALPFMRGSPPVMPVEPMLDAQSSVEHVDGTAAAEAEADAGPSTAGATPVFPDEGPGKPGVAGLLRGLLARLRLGGMGAADADRAWPLFSERFIQNLSPRRVARFTLRHGHSIPPGGPDWPQRIIAIDERLMAEGAAKAAGAWPYELYLMSAGIDAGSSRSRVLLAHGAGHQLLVLGRRCLDPRRLAAVAGAVLLLALLLWGLRRGGGHDEGHDGAATAASAPASATADAASAAPMPASATSPASAAAAAEPAASAASAAEPPASAAASAASTEAASAPPTASAPSTETAGSPPQPDIRPRLVPPRPGRTGSPETPPLASAPATKPAEATTAAKPAAAASRAPAESRKALGQELSRAREALVSGQLPALSGKTAAEQAGSNGAAAADKQVALVGPPHANKADAQAQLERMRGLLGESMGSGASALSSDVFPSPDGWRATVWPFSSREQAQLINATLIARGLLRIRAVDF